MGGGGLFSHLPLEASGTDRMKDGAHKDVITRTLGTTPCLVTLHRICRRHFPPSRSQCRTTNQKECLSVAYEVTNKAICLLAGCPQLTVLSTGGGQTQDRCRFYTSTFVLEKFVLVCFSWQCHWRRTYLQYNLLFIYRASWKQLVSLDVSVVLIVAPNSGSLRSFKCRRTNLNWLPHISLARLNTWWFLYTERRASMLPSSPG